MALKTPKTGNQTREIPSLSLRAAFQPSSVNVEKRTVDVVWTTGAPVLRSSWDDGPFYEELSLDPKHVRMGRLTSGGAPLLDSHASYGGAGSVLGVIEGARLGSKEGVATARFPSEGISPEADKVFRLVQDGIAKNVSVGYRVHKFEKVEGGDAKIPTYRAVDWEPYEVSVVPMGADAGATFRSDDTSKNPCTFISRSTESKTMTPEEIAAAEALANEKRDADLKAAREAAVAEERSRAGEIRLAVRALGAEGSAVAEKLINDNVTVDKARAFVLEALAKRTEATQIDGQVRIEVGEEASDKFKRGAEAWLVEKAGVRELIARGVKSGKIVAPDAHGAEFRGASHSDLARMFLESKGVKTRGMDRVKLFETAMNYRTGYSTTSDFAVLYESVLNKTMLSAYETAGDVWSKFCGTKEVPDFRPANFYRAGSFGVLPALSEHGEFQNQSIPDGGKSTVSVGTYGGMIGISRQAIINDDMGAMADLAVRFGEGARRTIEKKVFEQLALGSGLGPTGSDSERFFATAHGNINGTAAANTAASWDLDAYVMSQQQDEDENNFLNLVPSILLLARAKKTEAEVLNASTVKIGGTNGEPNTAHGAAKLIIPTSELTGTRRYWFCDPARNPAIVVAFLTGSGQAPQLFSAEGWRTDGTEYKVRMDFGVSFFDPKCAVTNAGA